MLIKMTKVAALSAVMMIASGCANGFFGHHREVVGPPVPVIAQQPVVVTHEVKRVRTTEVHRIHYAHAEPKKMKVKHTGKKILKSNKAKKEETTTSASKTHHKYASKEQTKKSETSSAAKQSAADDQSQWPVTKNEAYDR